MKTPVLLLCFNRPDTTRRVLEQIALAQPRQLFVACDGARADRPGERALVEETRQVIAELVTWECELHTRYHSENQGLRRGVVGALDWFFDSVPEGIILEDDCVPHQDFFPYCEELLDRYREDERVWAIQGDNAARVKLSGEASYSFVPYALIWGWATWRRAWEKYDSDLSGWKAVRGTPAVRRIWPDRVERRLWSAAFDGILADPDTTWDYQWAFTVFSHGGLTTIPRKNLISNIGWGRPDATHTTGTGSRQDAPTFPILPLVHPPVVERDRRASSGVLNGRVFGAGKLRFRYRFMKALRQSIRRVSSIIRGRNSRSTPSNQPDSE